MPEKVATRTDAEGIALFLLGAACLGIVWLCCLAVDAAFPALFCVGAN